MKSIGALIDIVEKELEALKEAHWQWSKGATAHRAKSCSANIRRVAGELVEEYEKCISVRDDLGARNKKQERVVYRGRR